MLSRLVNQHFFRACKQFMEKPTLRFMGEGGMMRLLLTRLIDLTRLHRGKERFTNILGLTGRGIESTAYGNFCMKTADLLRVAGAKTLILVASMLAELFGQKLINFEKTALRAVRTLGKDVA